MTPDAAQLRTTPQRGPARPQGPAPTLADLLEQTSRTFALSIPLLPVRLREQVTIAYLLFRIADTIEDEIDWPAADKASLLRRFAAMITGRGSLDQDDLVGVFTDLSVAHEGYARLMQEAAVVLDRFASLPDEPREAITRHLARTAEGMANHLEARDAQRDLDGTIGYCYTVAGIVGELCTELFILHDRPLAHASDKLMALAPGFGEGLQLVNILRDRGDDARAGRCFTPDETHADESTLIDRARRALSLAADYVRTLEAHGADPGTVAFNALNTVLAFETLALVERHGPGVKIRRERIGEIFREIAASADSRTPITPVIDRVAARLG